MNNEWSLVEPDVRTALGQFRYPLDELAAGRIPAVVIRGAWPLANCRSLLDRLLERNLIYDPHQPIPENFRNTAIAEGYYREGANSGHQDEKGPIESTGRTRIDIGTSLGYRGSDKEDFLAHSAESQALFEELFEDRPNPIRLIYEALEALSIDKRVGTARESDGRGYSPAIIRAHYGGYTYRPHFDSVRLREKRTNYAVHDFEHQFAGVLVLQNTHLSDQTAQCRLHRCFWSPDIDPHLKAGTFEAYAAQHGIENIDVVLQPGDLYFFNTRCIHEVPGVAGELPRVVLATFIGFSSDREEIFVWS